MQDSQKIIEIIRQICNEKKISVNKVLSESGAGKDLVANMQKGQTPAVNKFSDLADYLDVSVDYLLGRTNNPDSHKHSHKLQRGG